MQNAPYMCGPRQDARLAGAEDLAKPDGTTRKGQDTPIPAFPKRLFLAGAGPRRA